MEKPDIFGSGGNNNFVSFDEIENSFRTPTQRQDYYEPKPDQTAGTDDLSRLADPDGSANKPIEVEVETVVDHDHAMRTGERIAKITDTAIDFVLSNFVARNGESYRADERDLQDIAEAWGEISEDRQWNIGPEWTLAILYIMVYGPLVKQAMADRRMAEIEERQRQLEERMRMMETQTKNGNGNPTDIHIDPNYSPSPYTSQPEAEAAPKD